MIWAREFRGKLRWSLSPPNTFLLLLQWCFRFVFTWAWHAVAAISFADLKKSCQYKTGNSFFGDFLFCRLIKYLWKWGLNRTGLSQLLTADYLNTTASDILHLLFFQVWLQIEDQPPHFSGILWSSDTVNLLKINILLYLCQHALQLLPHFKEGSYVSYLCFSSHFFVLWCTLQRQVGRRWR